MAPHPHPHPPPHPAEAGNAVIVEQTLWLSLAELSEACDCEAGFIEDLVGEGVLSPTGATPDGWQFAGAALPRARLALRLARDLDLNGPGVALALQLLDEIAALQARLAHAG